MTRKPQTKNGLRANELRTFSTGALVSRVLAILGKRARFFFRNQRQRKRYLSDFFGTPVIHACPSSVRPPAPPPIVIVAVSQWLLRGRRLFRTRPVFRRTGKSLFKCDSFADGRARPRKFVEPGLPEPRCQI